jgi:hypothetical protein
MDLSLLGRELLARERLAKNMPEGMGDAGRQAAMPPDGAAEDCHPCWGAGQAPWSVPHSSHTASTVPFMVGRCARDPGVVPWRAMGRRFTRVAADTRGPRRPTRRRETPCLRPIGPRLRTRATLLPVPGPLPHRRGHRTPAHARAAPQWHKEGAARGSARSMGQRSRWTMALAVGPRRPGPPGGSARYRPRGLTSRIDEILLSLRPWSFTCR